MEIFNVFRRTSRVVKEICDTRYIVASAEEDFPYTTPNANYPVYLTVSVQVRVFIWLTIWSESCDITDGDTMQHILSHANRLKSMLDDEEGKA